MSKLKSFFSSSLLVAIAAASTACTADTPDILGLQLRLTPAEAATKLANRAELVETKSASIAYGRFSKELPGSTHTAQQTFIVSNPGLTRTQVKDTVDILYTPEHGAERSATMVREQFFAEGAQPKVDDRIRDYIAKYGQPALQGTYGMTTDPVLVWSFDANGKPRPVRKEALRYCNFGKGSIMSVGRGDREVGPYIELCGSTVLKLTLRRSTDPSLANQAYTFLASYGDIYAAQDRINAKIQAIVASEAKAEQQRMEANKPGL